MDISGISTSVSANSFASSSSARTDMQRSERMEEASETRRHDHGRRGSVHHRRALGAFRQELHTALKAQFRARFATAQQNYAAVREPASSDDVAAEALGAARQLVAESPTSAARSLISFRATVHETASYVRESVGADDDVDNAIARVDEGLTDLENEVASNRESSASVLAVDTSTRQRSTIKIRTQEGDVVKLSLRRADSMSATDVAVSNGDGSASSTEIEVSSRSRMMLSVEGDLNESEFAAIQNVFSQAERMADEFFGGDISAAFSLAEGFEFDTEQLARVNMRFRLRQESNITYSETVRTAQPAVAAPSTETAQPAVTAPSTEAAQPAVAAPSTETARPAVATPFSADTSRPVTVPDPIAAPVVGSRPISDPRPVDDVPVRTPDVVAPGDEPAATDQGGFPGIAAFSDLFNVLSDFLDGLSDFLRSVGEGFESESTSGSYSFHYSESFKLEILKSVIHTLATEESSDSAALAGAVIDGINDSAGAETTDS